MILPNAAQARWHFAPIHNITNTANNGSGVVRLAVSSTSLMSNTCTHVRVSNTTTSGGLVLDGYWPFNLIDGTHIDLVGSTFTGAWVSGGYMVPIANDGLPLLPGPMRAAPVYGAIDNTTTVGKLRPVGFSGTIVATTAGGYTFTNPGLIGPLVDPTKFPPGDPVFPIDITCNNYTADTVPGAHDFSWYVQQRKDPGWYPDASGTPTEFTVGQQILSVSMPDVTKSCWIRLSLNSVPASQLLPGLSGAQLLTADAFDVIFKHVYVYVTRYTDHAYQMAKVFERGIV